MNTKKIKESQQQYVEMYLSGQIQEYEWYSICQENSEVEREYKKFLRKRS